MKDLVCVVADKQIKATVEELPRRPLSLGIRPIEAELLLHPHHDPGCYARPADLLRGYRQAAEHGGERPHEVRGVGRAQRGPAAGAARSSASSSIRRAVLREIFGSADS